MWRDLENLEEFEELIDFEDPPDLKMPGRYVRKYEEGTVFLLLLKQSRMQIPHGAYVS